MLPPESALNYQATAAEIHANRFRDTHAQMFERFIPLWLSSYRQQVNRKTNITEMWSNGFSFMFDLEGSDHCDGRGPHPAGVFPRTVVAFGISKPPPGRSIVEDLRLRRWMGPTAEVFGAERDKGHFIASSVGGAIIAAETNIFSQRRDLNRGWSSAGKIFRSMETFAQNNPGTPFFNRPVYLLESDTPDFLEVGIVKADSTVWIEVFDNRNVANVT